MSDLREDEGSGVVDPKSDPQYIQFKCLPPGGALNRWSHMITREHDFPGAQVCYLLEPPSSRPSKSRVVANPVLISSSSLRPCYMVQAYPIRR